MQAEVEKRLFTVGELQRMDKAGIFGPDTRLELINGEILEMSPIGDRHMECVLRATRIFAAALLADKVILSVQNAVRINNITTPQPDIVLYRFRKDFYKGKLKAEDVMLLIEVSDSTLRYDRDVKLPIYAAAGIPEVWIEDLKRDQLLVYRKPAAGNFGTTLTFRHGDAITPLVLPEMAISIESLLGL